MPRSSSESGDRRGIDASGDGLQVEEVWRGVPTRLDRLLRSLDETWGRSLVASMISERRVRVNGRVVWMSSWQVERGDRISIDVPVLSARTSFDRFDPTWIVADDGDVVVVDKPSGLRSEAVRATDTTPNLLALARAALDDDLVLAHRLDRDTSGLLVLSRPGPIRSELDEMFRVHTITKRYEAIVGDTAALGDRGRLLHFLATDPRRRDAMVTVPKGGVKAVTDYEVTARADRMARVALWPRTGRTHQLRVQLATVGAPILGDAIYGNVESAPRLLLHATSLDLPATSGHPARRFESPTPF